ncbi:MAG: hypothetical protein JWO81_251, partial [Alphaproteobacteria bacterium]|nr:hypothetical protein [Alphaproteobacteria bacterium]
MTEIMGSTSHVLDRVLVLEMV